MAALAFTKSVSLLFHSVSTQGLVAARGWGGETGHLSTCVPCPCRLCSHPAQLLPPACGTIRWTALTVLSNRAAPSQPSSIVEGGCGDGL